jgi:hypothetical protein
MKVRWASGFSATEIGDYGEGRRFIARMAGSRGGIPGKMVPTGIRFRPGERRWEADGSKMSRESGSATFGNLNLWFWGCQAGEDAQFAYDFASEEQGAVWIFYRFAGVGF